MFHLEFWLKALVGKASSFASIGEAGEEAFPAGADHTNNPGKDRCPVYAPSELPIERSHLTNLALINRQLQVETLTQEM